MTFELMVIVVVRNVTLNGYDEVVDACGTDIGDVPLIEYDEVDVN